MVRLTVDLVARCTSGYTKKKRDESIQQYLKRQTHLHLENKNIDEIVSGSMIFQQLDTDAACAVF